MKEIKFGEPSKFTISKNVRGIRKFNKGEVEETLKNDRNIKTTKRRLNISRHQLLTVKDSNGIVTKDMEKVLRVAKKLYPNLYRHQDGQEDDDEDNDLLNLEVPIVTVKEIGKALKGMRRDKAGEMV